MPTQSEPDYRDSLTDPQFFVGKMLEAATEKNTAEITTRARALLGGHADLVPEETTAKIIRREVASSIEEAKNGLKEKVINGRGNIDHSRAPGIKVYLTAEGVSSMNRVCQKHGYPVNPAAVTQETEGVYLVDFPGGGYSGGGGSIQFYGELDGEDSKSRKPFFLNYNHVVRIEGQVGDLWQNKKFDWDLTPKEMVGTDAE